MGSKKKDQKNKRQCELDLNIDLDRSAERLKELERIQLAGDFSIELARKINVLRYHIEVLKNRLSGNFEASYRNELEIEVPKKP